MQLSAGDVSGAEADRKIMIGACSTLKINTEPRSVGMHQWRPRSGYVPSRLECIYGIPAVGTSHPTICTVPAVGTSHRSISTVVSRHLSLSITNYKANFLTLETILIALQQSHQEADQVSHGWFHMPPTLARQPLPVHGSSTIRKNDTKCRAQPPSRPAALANSAG